MNVVKMCLALSLAMPVLADDANRKLEEEIRQEILKNTSVSVTLIEDLGLSKCFAVPIYSAKITTKSRDGSSQQQSAVYAKTPKGVLEISAPSSESKMPELLTLIKPSFRLKTKEDGLAMLSAIKAIYVSSSPFNDDFVPRFVHEGKKWSFFTGKFFEKFSGFVMETDASGKITEIKYSLGIKG